MSADLDRERPRMRLIDWQRIDKGALIGRATVLLPSGLQISDIGIFIKDRARWAQMPSEPMRDGAGQLLRDDRGKARYRSPLKWRDRDLQERFSAALIALVEAEHGRIDGRESGTPDAPPRRRAPYPARRTAHEASGDGRPFDDEIPL